jgi:hypothetical protein
MELLQSPPAPKMMPWVKPQSGVQPNQQYISDSCIHTFRGFVPGVILKYTQKLNYFFTDS